MSVTDWNDEEVAESVRHALFGVKSSEDTYGERFELESIAPRAHAAILKILRDRTLHKKLVTPTDSRFGPESPLERACLLLGDEPTVGVIEALTPFLEDHLPKNRGCAACVIAKTGSTLIIPAVRHAFADTDETVSGQAIYGLELALRDDRLDKSAVPELFDTLCQLLRRGHNAMDGVDVLFTLNESNAIAYCLSDQVLKPDCKFLWWAIRKLHEKRVAAPPERLRVLLDQLDRPDDRDSLDFDLAAGLAWLGTLQDPHDRPRLEKYLTYQNKWVAQGAAQGMLESHGMQDFSDRILDKLPDEGFAGLTPYEERYYAVKVFDDEMDEYGFAQYFYSFSGDHWRRALEGLEAMQSVELLTILRTAMALFPNQSPSDDFDERCKQLDRLQEAEPDVFTRLDDKYHESGESASVLIMRYVLQHPEEFN